MIIITLYFRNKATNIRLLIQSEVQFIVIRVDKRSKKIFWWTLIKQIWS